MYAEHKRKTSGVHDCCSSAVPLCAKLALVPANAKARKSAPVNAARAAECLAMITVAR
jgi:hypothetical protein